MRKGSSLTLDKTVELARTTEAVDLQPTTMNQTGREKTKSEVNRVENRENSHTRSKGGTNGKRCYKCGEEGHFAKDGVCYQKSGGSTDMSRRCYRCGKEGHFAKDEQCPARKATCRKYKLNRHDNSITKQGPRMRRKEVELTE